MASARNLDQSEILFRRLDYDLVVFNVRHFNLYSGSNQSLESLYLIYSGLETRHAYRRKPRRGLAYIPDGQDRILVRDGLGLDIGIQSEPLPCPGPEHIDCQADHQHHVNGDYDGDTVTEKGIYSYEANEELEEIMNKKFNYINLGGTPIRTAGNEAFQSLYNLTLCLPEDESKMEVPTFGKA